ncbi:MAG TPA: hypothetical protein VJ717_17775 [Gemmatimonadaceae bacterium]|nr:hypothetical protein [Gemmatimonadaceae bacterium]
MRSVRRIAGLTGFMVAATAGAQQPSPNERLTGRLDEDTRAQVVALVDSLRREELPVEPLIDRALEGAAKRADGALIVRVVRGYAGHLRVARSVLGKASSDREIIAGANALKAGLKSEELSRVRAAREGVKYAVAFDVLTGLKNRNVPNDTAVRVIGSLVKLAANDQQYVTLLDQVDRAIADGAPPAVAASTQGITVERAILANANNSNAPGAALPSARGAVGDPAVGRPSQGTAAGVQPEGAGAPAPRGKAQKPRKP